MFNAFKKAPIATLTAWATTVLVVLFALQTSGVLTGTAAHWVDLAAGALQVILTAIARQHRAEGEVQAEEGQAEQQQVDPAEVHAEGGQEPDDRSYQGKHARLVPDRAGAQSRGIRWPVRPRRSPA